MNYEYYNPVDEKGGCIYRAISKALSKDYNKVKEEITVLENELKTNDTEEIFEEYLKQHNFKIIVEYKDKNLFDINYDGINVVFAKDNDWYHMICIINNTLYDKNDLDILSNMKIIKIYKFDN